SRLRGAARERPRRRPARASDVRGRRHALRTQYRGGMTQGQTLVFDGVTKRFGTVEAVSGLDFRVEPGRVTGFLGPNGAGKTTTLRMLLGLVAATSGTATIGGKRYRDLDRPTHV